MEGVQATTGVHILDVNARQSDNGSVRTGPGAFQGSIAGSDGGGPFNNPVPIPVAYFSKQMSSRLWLGLGVNAPFGLVVDYDDDFFGRYDSLRSELRTYNAQPSIAYKVNDALSIGAGVNIQYVEAELTNALPQLNPLESDGLARLQGDDISLGWNLGVAFERGSTRIGAHFRSGMSHEVRGTLEVSDLAGPLAPGNGVEDVRVDLELPDILTIGVRQGIGSNVRLLAGATWYNWSVFESIDTVGENGLISSVEQGYVDTFDVSLGAEMDLGKKWTIRAGTKWDETPTTDEFRTTRVPDGDRYWATFGATYKTGNMQISASYAHVFVDSSVTDRTEQFFEGTPAATTIRTNAVTRGNVDQIAVALTLQL